MATASCRDTSSFLYQRKTTRHFHSKENDHAGPAAFVRRPHYGDHATLGRTADDMARRPKNREKIITRRYNKRHAHRAGYRLRYWVNADTNETPNTKLLTTRRGNAQLQPAPLRAEHGMRFLPMLRILLRSTSGRPGRDTVIAFSPVVDRYFLIFV